MSYVADVTRNGVNSPVTSSLRGTCSTAAATAAKAVTCSSFDTLKTGVSIFVTFTNENTASNPTMNVNSTGAKSILRGSQTSIKWDAGTTVQFMYDGTGWQMISSAGSSEWGDITGDIENQTDLFNALAGKQATLTFDTSPTSGSNNPVKSSGIYTALAGKQATLTFDTSPTSGSNNPVKSSGIYTALAGKQATLTFDASPTSGSNNPVKSSGIYTALAAKAALASPTFTGTPKAPTAAAGNNTTQIATTAFVKSSGLTYVTTSPTAANTDGIKIAVLNTEPATKYAGWLYFIKE